MRIAINVIKTELLARGMAILDLMRDIVEGTIVEIHPFEISEKNKKFLYLMFLYFFLK